MNSATSTRATSPVFGRIISEAIGFAAVCEMPPPDSLAIVVVPSEALFPVMEALGRTEYAYGSLQKSEAWGAVAVMICASEAARLAFGLPPHVLPQDQSGPYLVLVDDPACPPRVVRASRTVQ
jgi:hypothetical protein